MLPGLILMSLLGSQIMQVISSPSAAELLVAAGFVAVWIAAAFGIQSAMSKYGRAA